jgi:hypothetical protein
MAIKIANTTVLDDNRRLVNTEIVSGVYTFLQPNFTVISNNIDFSNPMMHRVMTANQSFVESNKSEGRISVLLLDTSSSARTPTFTTDIQWAGNGNNPAWSSHRYWVISFVCNNSSSVLAAASGYTF